MNRILTKFHEQYPTISIKYDPTVNTEYNSAGTPF